MKIMSIYYIQIILLSEADAAAPVLLEDSASSQQADSTSSSNKPTEPAEDTTTQKGKYKNRFLSPWAPESRMIYFLLSQCNFIFHQTRVKRLKRLRGWIWMNLKVKAQFQLSPRISHAQVPFLLQTLKQWFSARTPLLKLTSEHAPTPCPVSLALWPVLSQPVPSLTSLSIPLSICTVRWHLLLYLSI